jgi:hypothetical protein
MDKFFDNTFELDIYNNVIVKIYPNLVKSEKDLLHTYLINIINFIAIKFNFDTNNKNIYIHQFKQNNYKDATGLLFMLLPHINDDCGGKKKSVMKLNDLYTRKINKHDINKESPVYEYTNIQYGRCKRINKTKAEEIQFNGEHLRHNFELLKDSINTIANKLYVNWIDVRPFRLDYINSKLFKVTDKYVKDSDMKIDEIYSGISIGEMYNVLTNYVYNDILAIKWMLYDMPENHGIYKLPYILNLVMGLENCVKFEKWNDSKKFIDGWNLLVDAFIHDRDIDIARFTISKENVSVIVVSIISYGRNTIMKEFGDKTLFNGIMDIDIDEIGNKRRNEYIQKIRDLLNRQPINPKIIYNYLSKCFFRLSKTCYSSYYLEFVEPNRSNIGPPGNHYKIHSISQSFISLHNTKHFPDDNFVTIKCMYNFAKSLCHDEYFNIYPSQWKSMDRAIKSEIANRLNNNNYGWFNINSILNRRKSNRTTTNYVYSYIKPNLAHVILTVLLDLGLLTEFIPDSTLSDHSKLPPSTDDRKKKIKELVYNNVLNNYKKSTYYLDNMPYEAHEVYTDKFIPYFDALKIQGDWMTFHAMDWISQINTFHHYLNNRIMYVTGGTGVGKSTQFPKLLLYALKMCDYKNDASIVCTAPRINALTGNAEWISKEMGVPIVKEIKNTKIPIQNYNIQYDYKDGSHSKKQYGLKLKIVTDGILEVQLNNQLLKKQIMENNIKKYTSENEYDIVVIDEAHEHNTNMDLILTKMKYANYYNNDLKLVIISATMDDDEPIYRRYYRNINDNRMYPLSKYIEENNLDRINVDRRLHIAPPNTTTQFPIYEKYAPYDYTSKDQMAEDIVLKILSTTSDDGDILLFQPGLKEINKSVKHINSKSNQDVIAIPYYSNLSTGIKQFIENIDKKKSQIPFSKEDLIKDQSKLDLNSGKYTNYRRVVIVSTEIAEASITIKSLRYIVDTGIQKINNFDADTRSETLQKRPISESSRLQRKGRLGRVAAGTAYYAYEKGARADIKRPYKIAVSYIGDNIFNMLCDKYHVGTNTALFNDRNDPNKVQFNYGDNMGYGIDGIDKIIKKQYFISKQFYTYYGNDNQYDYSYDKNHVKLSYYYPDGYDMNTLSDEDGTFYIIHPDELHLERNILGTIVKGESDFGTFNDNKFVSNKINVLKSMMQENLFIVVDNKKTCYKTEFGTKVMALKQYVSLFERTNFMLSYLYSLKYECHDDMLKVLVGANANLMMSDFTLKGHFKDMMLLYGNKSGDGEAIIKILDFVITWFESVYKKMGLVNELVLTHDKKKDWNNIKMLYFKGEYDKIDGHYMKILLKLDAEGKLNKDNITIEEEDQLKGDKIYFDNIEKVKKSNYIEEFKKICANKYLDYEKVLSLYKSYKRMQYLLYKIKDKLQEVNKLTPLVMKNYKRYDMDNVLKFCLIQGNPNNMLKKITLSDKEQFYINLLDPSIYNVHKIPKVKKEFNTFIKNDYVGDIILFLNTKDDIETDEDNVVVLFNIDYKMIPDLLPMVMISKKNNFGNGNYKKHMEKYINMLGSNNNDLKYNILNNYVGVVKDIEYKLFNNFDKSKVKELLSIAGSDNVVKGIINGGIIGNVGMSGGGNYNVWFGANYAFFKCMLRMLR